jgi:ATP-dependent Clp protease ATP-binding subunit ClpX
LNRQGMGFGAEIKAKDERAEYLKQIKAEDLIQYGFESEFIGRLPVVTVFEHLEVEDLYNILRNPKSPIIIGKKRDFKAYGIDLQFEEEALHRIAENACQERTGARGLVSAVEKVLLKFEHTLPSTAIRHLVVTREMVDDPIGELHKILENPEDAEREALFQRFQREEEMGLEKSIRKKEAEFVSRYGISFSPRRIHLITKRAVDRRADVDSSAEEVWAIHQAALDFERGFSSRNEVRIHLTEEAIDRLIERTWGEGLDPAAFLKQSFQNYEHGLKLIKEKTGKEEFSLPPEGIENPDHYLNRLIRETYKSE